MKKKSFLILSIVIILVIIIGVIKINSGAPEVVNNEININEIITEEIPDGSFEGESQLEVEGFEEENPEFISGSSSQSNDFIVGASVNTDVYYSQIDSRWKNLPYTATGNKSQTIGSSGCGPTSAAMVVSTIKGVVYPNEIANLYVKNGFRSANNGTYMSAFEWTANKYGIEFNRVYSVDNMVSLLRNNYMVIVSCSDGLFTTGGHIIVVYGIDGDTLKIFDPYLYNGKFNSYGRQGKVTVSGNTVYCSINNFKAYGNTKAYFGFKRENSTYINKYTNGRVLVDIPVKIAYQGSTKSYDDSLVDNNGYQFWIKNSVIINNHVYGLADICYDGGETDILQIFDRQFWCNEIYMSDIPVQKEQVNTIKNTIGQQKKLNQSTVIYSKNNLTGTKYNYKVNTTITILDNISNSVDKVKVNATGRVGYIDTKFYK